MSVLLACVDGSSYTNAVCDHAAWLAGRMDADVDLLHAIEPGPAPSAAGSPGLQPGGLLTEAGERLEYDGLAPRRRNLVTGRFVDAAASLDADVVVIGKRGVNSDGSRARLGSNTAEIVRRTEVPVCLASQVFLPPEKAVVLMDAELDHRRALEFLNRNPEISARETDVAVIALGGQDPEPKLAWARSVAAGHAEAFAIAADSVDDGVRRYMQSRKADLIVISRAVLSPDRLQSLTGIEEDGLWGWRCPVLVC